MGVGASCTAKRLTTITTIILMRTCISIPEVAFITGAMVNIGVRAQECRPAILSTRDAATSCGSVPGNPGPNTIDKLVAGQFGGARLLTSWPARTLHRKDQTDRLP